MPVQINEMLIRAHVKEAASPGSAGGAAAKTATHAAAGAAANKEEIIKECIEAVLEFLSRKNER